MGKHYVLGIDFGGGASKATLLCEDGTIAATATAEYPTYFPQNGWAEQNPEDSFDALIRNVREILGKSQVDPKSILCMAISAASQTGVYLDENDQPVRNSIYWIDGRSAPYAAALKQKMGDWIYRTCYNVPTSARTISHLLWLKNEEPHNFSRIKKVLFVKDYLRYRLTGDFVTDYIDAMGSLLMDVDKGQWSPSLCATAGIKENTLPQILSPTDFVGPIRQEICQLTGLSPSTRIIVGSTDTVMEIYANGAIHPGQMTVKLATAGRICPITTKNIPNHLLVNYKHIIPGLWYPGTGTKSCAMSFRWYRDVFCQNEVAKAKDIGCNVYDLLTQQAQTVPPCSDQLYFHPYLQGEQTPYWNAALRASFVGISSRHTKAHFSRALLEGVGFSLKDCLRVLQKEPLEISEAIIIGGGANSPLWRQIVADMLGISLLKTQNADSSMGSAMLAAVAMGFFSSFDESVKRCVRTESIVHPDPRRQEIYEKGFGVYQSIQKALEPIYNEMERP